ncbi:choice-of-anchor M domain-containing protein [Ruania halotolerans]|uniref:choice-of-anchor M domain-containing protein n=1 Tax=Ruania halotolerans TaxID=2897773 RepID=UPI001E31D2E6|nr:choice-of-anchor M domain-containing protein [Ruania halotolerans]UFU05369.1 choice-of-anchor M domain-containing protein [Ruania halotolerans]
MHHRPVTIGATTGVLALALSGLILVSPAAALDGHAPAPTEVRVLSRIHTDAVSTFIDDGALALASQADVPEGDGTRLDPAATIFHLDDDARTTVPPGYDFIAEPGSEVWVAPEGNPMGSEGYEQLWPGFSTESVPAGALENDRTAFTLTEVTGPGDLELYTGSGENLDRLWSSDDNVDTFTMGRTHMHANWAFTEPGTYQIDVTATAAGTGGSTLSASATYTFVVGDLAAPRATSTDLSVDVSAITENERVTLTASVLPADLDGYVEFYDGERILGHERLDSGSTSIQTTAVRLGVRELTAHYVPMDTRTAAPSTSEPVTVTVLEEGAEDQFGIAGWKDTYAAGENVELSAQGVSLEQNEELRWHTRRSASADQTYVSIGSDPRMLPNISTHWNEVQIRLSVWDAVEKEYTQETAWHTFTVSGANQGSGEQLTISGMNERYYLGDTWSVTVEHSGLDEGETIRFATRSFPYGTEYDSMESQQVQVEGTSVTLQTSWMDSSWTDQPTSEGVLQIVSSDGTVLGQSAPFAPYISKRELILTGGQDIYRVGQTIELNSSLEPGREGLEYQWGYGISQWQFEPIDGATSTTVSLPVTAEMDGRTLGLLVSDAATGASVNYAPFELRVVDAADGEQVVIIDGLGAHGSHYHQGTTIELRALADPAAADTDTFRWEWQRPDQADWHLMETATAAEHEVIAEQALDGTLVRVTMMNEAGEALATSPSATILVDDHGADPRQNVQIAGLEESYTAGEEITLTASVDPDSVLSRYAWTLTPHGGEPRTIDSGGSAQLVLPATEDLDGAAISAALVFDDASTYVASEPVTLAVTPAPADPDDGTTAPDDDITTPTEDGAAPGQQEPRDGATQDESGDDAAQGESGTGGPGAGAALAETGSESIGAGLVMACVLLLLAGAALVARAKHAGEYR